MGYRVKLGYILSYELFIFQFPLWDTSLKDGRLHQQLYYNFNSLYGIQRRGAMLSIGFLRKFQFPLWDTIDTDN